MTFTCDTPDQQKPVFPCHTCGEPFGKMRDLQIHRMELHGVTRRIVRARDRPKNRGPIPCGAEGCDYSFANMQGRYHHRLAKHGLKSENIP